MAVTIAQSATFATGAGTTLSFTLSTAGTATVGNTSLACVVCDVIPSAISFNSAGVLGTLIASDTAAVPYVFIYRVVVGNTIGGALNVTFPGQAHVAAYNVETTGKSVSNVTSGSTTLTTLSVTGSTPPFWAPAAGDLPLGFFALNLAETVTPQTGWTEVANLNNTAGQFAQLEVQSGPATTTTPQNVTAMGTFTVTGGPLIRGYLVTASSAGPYALLSQEATEVLAQDTALGRISQATLEAVAQDTANAHLSQEVLEAVAADTALGRVSQVVLEAIIPLYTRMSQEVLEVVGLDTAKMRVSQSVVEVLFSSQGARRRTVEDELFTY